MNEITKYRVEYWFRVVDDYSYREQAEIQYQTAKERNDVKDVRLIKVKQSEEEIV